MHSCLSPCTKLDFKCIKDLNTRQNALDLIEKKVWNRLELTSTGKNFLNRTPIAQTLWPITNEWDPWNWKCLYNKQHRHLGKAAAYVMGEDLNCLSSPGGLLSKIYKELKESRKQIAQLENGAQKKAESSQKRKHSGWESVKETFNPQPPGKCKITLRDFISSRQNSQNWENKWSHMLVRMQERGTLVIADGSASYGNQHGGTLEAQIRSASRSNCATLRHIPKEVSILQGGLLNHVHCCSIIITRHEKLEIKRSSTDGRITKLWYTYTMECYWVAKRNEVINFADKSTKLEKESYRVREPRLKRQIPYVVSQISFVVLFYCLYYVNWVFKITWEFTRLHVRHWGSLPLFGFDW